MQCYIVMLATSNMEIENVPQRKKNERASVCVQKRLTACVGDSMERKNIININRVRASEFYKPTKPSAEAMICLTCPLKECKTRCERYIEEKKKLRECHNDRV